MQTCSIWSVHIHTPSKRHAHNNWPRLFWLLHTVSVQYTGQAPSIVKNKDVWLSAHGRLPGTLWYYHNYSPENKPPPLFDLQLSSCIGIFASRIDRLSSSFVSSSWYFVAARVTWEDHVAFVPHWISKIMAIRGYQNAGTDQDSSFNQRFSMHRCWKQLGSVHKSKCSIGINGFVPVSTQNQVH